MGCDDSFLRQISQQEDLLIMECDKSFREKITQQEGLLFDRKAYVELWHDRHKASFIKDIIALANTSRFTGKGSELILGVKDDGNIHGIKEMIDKLGGNINGVKKYITQTIERYIEPEIKAVDINAVSCDGRIILSIIIPALRDGNVFKVRRKLDGLDTGRSWIRTGESNTPLTPEMEKNYPPYTKCPYIFPEQWLDYLINLQEKFKHTSNIQGYQELLSNNGKEMMEEIEDFLDSGKKILVLTGEAAIGKTTILERLAYGRSKLLQGDIQNFKNLENLKNPSRLYYPIGFIPIFVSLRDRRIKEVRQLEDLLLDRLCEGLRFRGNRPEELNRLFENPEYHFVVLLDGFDELYNEQAKRQFIQTLEDMARKYPELKFILTTRPPSPSFADEFRNEISEIKIQPFTSEQIRKYIESHCDRETLEKVETWIYSNEELTKICSIPFYLETALPEIIGEYRSGQEDITENMVMNSEPDQTGNEEDDETFPNGINTFNPVQAEELILNQPVEERTEAPVSQKFLDEEQDIQIGVMLDRIYRKAWKRETQKRNFNHLDTKEFWNQTEKLAVSVNLGAEISYKQVKKFMRKKSMLFCLGLSVLTELEEMTRVRFFTELTQAIFAANQLKTLIEGSQQRFDSKFNQLSDRFREKVTPILQELSSNFYLPTSQEE